MRLTSRQRDLLHFVRAYQAREEISPTYAEIAEHLGYRSLSTVHELVAVLVAKGFLRKSFNTVRSLELVEVEPEEVGVPSERNGWEIPPGAKFVPVTALEGLFSAWLRRRRFPGEPEGV